MSSPPLPRTVLAPDWVRALEQVEAALARMLAETAAPAQGLEPDPPPAARGEDGERLLARVDERLGAFQSRVQRAEEGVAQADADLRAAAQALQTWLAEGEALARKLAAGGAGSVS